MRISTKTKIVMEIICNLSEHGKAIDHICEKGFRITHSGPLRINTCKVDPFKYHFVAELNSTETITKD